MIGDPAALTTAQGRGFAKSYDPAPVKSSIPEGLIDNVWEKYKVEKQRKVDAAKNIQTISSYSSKIPQFKEEFSNRIKGLRDAYVDGRVNYNQDFLDPESQGFTAFNDQKMALEQDLETEKLALDRMQKIQQEAMKGGTKYDQEILGDWNNRWQNAGSFKEASAIILGENPLVENIDFLADIPVLSAQQYGVVSEKDIEAAAKNYILNRDAKDPSFLESGTRKKMWKNEDEALDFYKGEIRRMSKSKLKSGGSGSGGGGGGKDRKYEVVATEDQNVGGYTGQGEANLITFVDRKAGKSFPPLNLTVSGQPKFVQVQDISKDASGQWVMRYKDAKQISTADYAELPDDQKRGFNSKTLEDGEQVYVSITSTETKSVPIKDGDGNSQIIGAVLGVNPFEVAKRKKKNTAPAQGKTPVKKARSAQ